MQAKIVALDGSEKGKATLPDDATFSVAPSLVKGSSRDPLPRALAASARPEVATTTV